MQIDSTADTQVKKVADTYHFIQCYAIKRRKNNHFNIPRNLTNLFNTEFRYYYLGEYYAQLKYRYLSF